MNRVGVLLYGAPATGKDTVSAELTQLDGRFEHFERVKVGSGNSSKYRMATPADAAELRRRGEVIYENERYGNVYIVDRPGLNAVFAQTHVPIVHMGQVAGVEAVLVAGGTWVAVALICDQAVAVERMRVRGDIDIDRRVVAWQETMADIAEHGLDWAMEIIDTGSSSAADSAARIAQLVKEVEDAQT